MPIFEYKAYDTSGGNRTGIVDADSPRDARGKLRADGIHVIEISSIEEKKKQSKKASGGFFAPRVNQNELVVVTRQLATLLKAGITIVEALKALIDQVDSRDMEKVLRDVREKVTQGDTLGEAMAYHPRFFNNLYVSMVKAGEASGRLDTILHRLSEYTTRQNRLKNKIAAALTYPIVMIFVGLIVVCILMIVVVPQLTSIFSKVGKALPGITQVLIGISDFFVGYWWTLIIVAVLAYMFFKAMRSTEEGRLRFDRGLMRVPVVGDLFRKTAIARFATTTATLLRSGIPVLEALKIVKAVVQNALIAKTIGDVHDAILEGSDIATPLQKSGAFPPMVGYMIATGEQSGQLDELLESVAESYDEEIDMATQRLTSVLEPVIIIGLAGVVLFVVAAIVIPLMQMGSLAER